MPCGREKTWRIWKILVERRSVGMRLSSYEVWGISERSHRFVNLHDDRLIEGKHSSLRLHFHRSANGKRDILCAALPKNKPYVQRSNRSISEDFLKFLDFPTIADVFQWILLEKSIRTRVSKTNRNEPEFEHHSGTCKSGRSSWIDWNNDES